MSQQDFDEADCLLVKSQTPYANLLAEPCLTCRKIFHQPGDDLSYERITHLNGREFLKSVQGNCDWCTMLWEKIERRGLARAIDISRLLDTFISFEFRPTTNGIGNFNFFLKEANFLTCSVKPTLECQPDKCFLYFTMTKIPSMSSIPIYFVDIKGSLFMSLKIYMQIIQDTSFLKRLPPLHVAFLHHNGLVTAHRITKNVAWIKSHGYQLDSWMLGFMVA